MFSASQLSAAYQQLFLFNGSVSSGSALNNAGMITDGNNMSIYGNALATAASDQKITVTVMYNRNGGTRYYVNGENIGNNTGWKAGNATWKCVLSNVWPA